MNIRPLGLEEDPPMKLLFLADPSMERVKRYLAKGQCYIGEVKGKVVGVYVLLEIEPNTVEIMNIAIDEAEQGKGYGKQLILHAIQQAKRTGFNWIEIGTGNSSIKQLALYQKSGFRITAIEHDFFVKNYKEKIIENGIECRDMIRLTLELG
jgi:ribosomal protein S18 acetylase RimI-like enzyme